MTDAVDPSSVPVAPAMEEAAGVVRHAASCIEDAFLVAGDALGTALSVVDEAVKGVEAIPRSITGPEMAEASETLWRIASELSAVVDSLPREREALTDVTQRLDALRTPLDRLVTSIRTIAILARSARVETAYLSANQLNFTEFADEILALADEAREGVNGFVRSFSTLTRLLSTARAAQATFDDERRAQIAESVRELQSAFDAIEERQHDAVGVSRDLAQRSRRVSDLVASASWRCRRATPRASGSSTSTRPSSRPPRGPRRSPRCGANAPCRRRSSAMRSASSPTRSGPSPARSPPSPRKPTSSWASARARWGAARASPPRACTSSCAIAFAPPPL